MELAPSLLMEPGAKGTGFRTALSGLNNEAAFKLLFEYAEKKVTSDS